MTSPILVPTDGSPESERALDIALPLATALDLPLCCLWDWEGLQGLDVDLAAGVVEEVTAREVADRAERLRELIARRITNSNVACDYRTPIGEPTAAIVAAAADVSARYIVMATHGRSGFKRWRLGSVADRVVQTSAIPVVLLRPEEESAGTLAIRRILVPLDGSPLAATALEEAVPIARACGASLLLLRSVMAFVPIAPMGMDTGFAEANVLAHRAAADSLQSAAAHCEGVTVETSVSVGSASGAILTEAANVDLIIMATHGRSGLRRTTLGSVADAVMRGSGKPVMLVRRGAPPVTG